MKGSPRTVLLVCVVLAALATSTMGQLGGEKIAERQSRCWDCHVADETPLKSLYDIIPPAEFSLAPGERGDYTVQITNPWLHDVQFIEPTLDLSQAPSLKFFDGREPQLLEAVGTAEFDPTPLVDPSATPPTVSVRPVTGYVTLDIPVGASDMAIAMVELEPFIDPTFTLNVYPGQTEPNGTAAITRTSQGGAAFVEIPEEELDFASLGYGNWTFEFVVDPSQGEPVTSDIDFFVGGEVQFNSNEQPTQTLSRAVLIKPGQSTLVTWRLEAIGTPGPGESVDIGVDGLVYWKHKASSNAIDHQNIIKAIPEPLAVVDQDGSVVITSNAAPPAPAVIASVTWGTISEAIGYATAFLLIGSVYTGGMFGKATRRQLNRVFGSAKRRVAFHNFLSYGLIVAGLVHAVIFVIDAIEPRYYFTVGLIWGGIATLAMIGLGFTGALQVPMIRKWNYASWRWIHLGLAIGTLVFTVVHMLLDGAHFGAVQEAIGWKDPLDNRGVISMIRLW